MKPSQVAEQLRKIAAEVVNSENPSLSETTDKINQIIAALDSGEDFWLSREDISAICPPCADRMAQLRIKKVAASAIFGQDMLLLAAEKTADKWETMPKGWTSESRKKLWKSLGESVSECTKKMEGKVTNPGSFCSTLKDKVEGTKWRHEKKK